MYRSCFLTGDFNRCLSKNNKMLLNIRLVKKLTMITFSLLRCISEYNLNYNYKIILCYYLIFPADSIFIN